MSKKTLLIAAGICGLATAGQAQIYDPSLVAWYKFDEGAGATTATNSVAGGTNGTVSATGTGSVTTGVAGVSGNAYQFTKGGAVNTGGFVDMGNANFLSALNTTQQLTITTWINTNSTAANGVRNVAVFAGNDTLQNTYLDIGYSGSGTDIGKAYVRNRPNNITTNIANVWSGTGAGNDQWHQVVMTLDVSTSGGTLSLYFDGAFVNSLTLSGTNDDLPTLTNFEIGRLGRLSPVDYFAGLIDDVQVYDKVLNSTEVNYLFNNPGQALTVVPEPAEVSMAVAAGLGLLVALRRRRQRA